MRGLYCSVSGHVHSMEGLGKRELSGGWFCHVCVATVAEHMLWKSVCGISLRSSMPTKCQPATPPLASLCPVFIYFSKYMYIFSTQNIELLFCDTPKEDGKKKKKKNHIEKKTVIQFFTCQLVLGQVRILFLSPPPNFNDVDHSD